MGPQLGYFYPEIVQQIDLHGPGIKAQGVAVPGLAMYILIGRTQNYAWSLTSANHDVRDVFAEQLCNPDGSAPTRASTHYLFKGQCRAFEEFNAGLLNGTPLRYRISVHGPVIGTATVGGKPYALARKRSTFGRDALNLGALKDLTEGKATSPDRFYSAANQFGFTFNWAYVSRKATAYFSSGYLPRRAKGLDRRLPTLGTGNYEWQGFLSKLEHPHEVAGPGGLLLNWNNKSAPGFMHGDDEAFGSVHRVELFDKFPGRVKLTDDVGVMNRAATEDVRSPVWPVVSRVLHSGPAPSARDQKVVDLLDDWVRRDAPRLDADNSGLYDEASPAIMDALWPELARAVMGRVLGKLLPDVDSVRGLGGLAGESYVDKDLRTLLGDHVDGAFNLRYCGEGSLQGVPRLAVVHAPRDRGLAGNEVRQPGSDHLAGRGEPDRLPAGPDPEHDEDHEPPDLPAGARVPAPARAAGALGLVEAVEVELEPGEAAAVGGGLATPAVRQVLDQQQAVAAVGMLDALRRVRAAPARIEDLDAHALTTRPDSHLHDLVGPGAAMLHGVRDELAEHERHAVAHAERQAGLDRDHRATRDARGTRSTGHRELRLSSPPSWASGEVPKRPVRTYMFRRTPATLGHPPAPWRSGYAAACKAVYTGSIPVGASVASRPDRGFSGRAALAQTAYAATPIGDGGVPSTSNSTVHAPPSRPPVSFGAERRTVTGGVTL